MTAHPTQSNSNLFEGYDDELDLTDEAEPARPNSTHENTNELTPEEEKAISGNYDAKTQQLVTEEYKFQQDQEVAQARPASEKASIRLVTVAGAVGGTIATGAFIWFTFVTPKDPVQKVATSPSPTPSVAPIADQTAELKSELAFADQKKQVDQSKSVTTRPAPKSRPPVRSTTAYAASPRPATPVVHSTSSMPAYQPAIHTSAPSPVVRAIPSPEVNEDPFDRWAKLAQLGQETGKPSEEIAQSADTSSKAQETVQANLDRPIEDASNSQSNSPTDDATPVLVSQPPRPVQASTCSVQQDGSEIQTVSIGAPSNEMSEGMRGILNRTPVTANPIEPTEVVDSSAPKEVTLGTVAKGKVVVPLIATETQQRASVEAQPLRGAIVLTEPLLAKDGTVALPQGSVLIIKTTATKTNLVQASAIAVVHPDSTGKLRQDRIPENTLAVAGREQSPLMGNVMRQNQPLLSGQDLLVGVLGGLSQVGQVINQPQTQISSAISGGTYSQTTTTTSTNPKLWAAALQGALQPTVQRLSQRLSQQVQAREQSSSDRTPVVIVPKDQEVTVAVQNILFVNP